MDESRTEDIIQVTNEENDILIESFSEKGVQEAIFQMKHNKAPGLMASLWSFTEFYQVFWSLIKHDLMAIFQDSHRHNLPIFSLNFGVYFTSKTKGS